MSKLYAAKFEVIKSVLHGLLNRYASMSTCSHPGWDDGLKHREELVRVRFRIMDQVAMCWPEDEIPDRVCIFHDHTIYLLDFVEGEMKAIGSMPRHLPCDLEIMHVLEVG